MFARNAAKNRATALQKIVNVREHDNIIPRHARNSLPRAMAWHQHIRTAITSTRPRRDICRQKMRPCHYTKRPAQFTAIPYAVKALELPLSQTNPLPHQVLTAQVQSALLAFLLQPQICQKCSQEQGNFKSKTTFFIPHHPQQSWDHTTWLPL